MKNQGWNEAELYPRKLEIHGKNLNENVMNDEKMDDMWKPIVSFSKWPNTNDFFWFFRSTNLEKNIYKKNHQLLH